MSGCQTCGGFGGHHDPIAHGVETYDDGDIGGLGSGPRYPASDEPCMCETDFTCMADEHLPSITMRAAFARRLLMGEEGGA